MKAKNLETVTVEDLKNFIEGTGNYKQVQKDLDEVTGFEKSILDLDTSGEFSDSDILNADLINEL